MQLATDVLDRLSDSTQAEVRELATAVAARDGEPPLSDQSLLHLAATGVHVVTRHGPTLVGYAQVRDGDAELLALADPSALFEPVETAGATRIWAHGRQSPIGPALEQRGYRRVRELWQLRRPLTGLQEVAFPAGVELRAFRPGSDEDAWLAVNTAAFAAHPEQGRWQRADLEARLREPWFDPAGFLLAVDGHALLGFHWTKVHPGTELGEVYVLAVAPEAQGRAVGAALLWAGMRHLAAVGCATVLLYVDGDNTRALALYERAGFARYDLDAQYTRL